jgi:hypothetical protein
MFPSGWRYLMISEEPHQHWDMRRQNVFDRFEHLHIYDEQPELVFLINTAPIFKNNITRPNCSLGSDKILVDSSGFSATYSHRKPGPVLVGDEKITQ